MSRTGCSCVEPTGSSIDVIVLAEGAYGTLGIVVIVLGVVACAVAWFPIGAWVVRLVPW